MKALARVSAAIRPRRADAVPASTSGRQPSALLLEEGGVGGVSDYTAELAAALAAHGWRVDVVTGRLNRYPDAPGVTVHALFPYVRGEELLVRVLRKARLSTVINGLGHFVMIVPILRLARRADIVHDQGEEWPPLGAAHALLLRAAGHRFIYTPHNTFVRGARSYRRVNALIRRCAARIIVHSEYDRTVLDSAEAAKAVVIPHGEYSRLAERGHADADRSISRQALGLPSDALVVLLFGQLRRDKGVIDLLLAAREIPKIRVVLAGADGGALAEAAELLEDPAMRDRVSVREGYVSQEEVGTLFAAADVVALPYHVASASGVLLLAYGHARPVVVYPVGGLPEYVVDGSTGWLCARSEPAALVETLREVQAAGSEECLRRGEGGRRLADERFGWDVIAARTIALYEDVLAGR